MPIFDLKQPFICVTAEEVSDFLPNRGGVSPLEAYIMLKSVLFACNRVEVKQVKKHKIELGRFQKDLSLTYLMKLWRWNDKPRVSRFLKTLEKKGFITLQKVTKKGAGLICTKIGLTIVSTTQPTTQPTTNKTTLKGIDNQLVIPIQETRKTTPLTSCQTTPMTTKERSKENTLSLGENLEDMTIFERSTNLINYIYQNESLLNGIKDVFNQKFVEFSNTRLKAEIEKFLGWNTEHNPIVVKMDNKNIVGPLRVWLGRLRKDRKNKRSSAPNGQRSRKTVKVWDAEKFAELETSAGGLVKGF